MLYCLTLHTSYVRDAQPASWIWPLQQVKKYKKLLVNDGDFMKEFKTILQLMANHKHERLVK